jgi:KUP system potassium uptake protein
MSHTNGSHITSPKKLFFLSLGALGVVYGDIGTSPLYAIKEIFFGGSLKHITQPDIFGAISLVLWALTIVVSFKYVFFVLRADNEGEGGVFALFGLLKHIKRKGHFIVIGLLIFAAGLLLGDGIITPAISVVSATEGLSVITRAFDPFVVPITIVILTGLFFIQNKGTAKVGAIFGPVMLVWFIVIALLGFVQIVNAPGILSALNPMHAVWFLTHHSIHTLLLVLGSVMLVITGGEAMYADMGHFGRLPIRISWYTIAYPALILNYLGQGAYMLSGQPVINDNLFYSMVPSWGLIPMVVLATMATVIASQALISGAFSLSTQAISLGLFPFLDVEHTNHEHEGQIYVPFVNWSLYVGAVLLVFTFQSSARLASAYGLAVSGVMFVTTLGMIIIAEEYWKWKPVFAYLLFIPLLIIDAVFLGANSLKFIEGGYIPVAIGISILFITKTWQWGRSHVSKAFKDYPVMRVKDLIVLKHEHPSSVRRTVVIMSPDPINDLDDHVPLLQQLHWERFGVIPQDIIFMTIVFKKYPHVRERFSIKKFYGTAQKGTIVAVKVFFGYMEEPDVESVLADLAKEKDFVGERDYHKWLVRVIHERIVFEDFPSVVDKIRFAVFRFIQRNTKTADTYFGLGQDQPLTIEILPVFI